MEREPVCRVKTWGVRAPDTQGLRAAELALERQVSRVIGTMPLLWLRVDGPAGSASRRGYIERNMPRKAPSAASGRRPVVTGPCASDCPPDEHCRGADHRLVGALHLHLGPAGVRRALHAASRPPLREVARYRERRQRPARRGGMRGRDAVEPTRTSFVPMTSTRRSTNAGSIHRRTLNAYIFRVAGFQRSAQSARNDRAKFCTIGVVSAARSPAAASEIIASRGS